MAKETIAYACIIAHNKVIEKVGSTSLSMIKHRQKLVGLFGFSWRYWDVVELSAAQVEKYNSREPGSLAIYEES